MRQAKVCRSCGDLTWTEENLQKQLGNWGGRKFWICPTCFLYW